MEITLKYYSLCKLIGAHITGAVTLKEKAAQLVYVIDHTYGLKLNQDAVTKIELFFKGYEKKMRECRNALSKFNKNNEDWLNTEINTEIEKKKLLDALVRTTTRCN